MENPEKLVEDAFSQILSLHSEYSGSPKAQEAFRHLVDDLGQLAKAGSDCALALCPWFSGRFWALPWDAWGANAKVYETFGKSCASLGLLAGWNLLEIADRPFGKSGEKLLALAKGIEDAGLPLSVEATDGKKDWFVWHLCSNLEGKPDDGMVEAACSLAEELPQEAWFVDKSWWGPMSPFLAALPIFSGLGEKRAMEFSAELIRRASAKGFGQDFWRRARLSMAEAARGAQESASEAMLSACAALCEAEEIKNAAPMSGLYYSEEAKGSGRRGKGRL